MKMRKLLVVLIIIVLAVSLLGCDPKEVSWTDSTSTRVHIVDWGLHPDTQTVTFNFGLNTIELKDNGYTKLTFTLTFSALIDTGFFPSATVEAILKDDSMSTIGVGWNNLTYTNTTSRTYTYTKSVSIDKLLQEYGKLYLTFNAVKNTLQTGTYIGDIEITVVAS